MVIDDQPPMPLSYVPPDLTAPGMAFTARFRTEGGIATLCFRQPGKTIELRRRDP